MDNFTNFQIYTVSFYFTVTTITTVGYGDISGSNSSEKYVSNFIMVLGVILFSLISTAITTIIQNYDNINIVEQEQRAILDKII
jgi:hypothetical protein